MIGKLLPVSVCDADYIPQGEWKKGYFYRHGIASGGYDLYYMVNGKDVYFKPMNLYFSAEFELMFNFGIGCVKFNSEKVVKVMKPDDYHKIFSH